MILLLSGLKENSDVYMLKLWGKGIFKMRLYYFYIEQRYILKVKIMDVRKEN